MFPKKYLAVIVFNENSKIESWDKLEKKALIYSYLRC